MKLRGEKKIFFSFLHPKMYLLSSLHKFSITKLHIQITSYPYLLLIVPLCTYQNTLISHKLNQWKRFFHLYKHLSELCKAPKPERSNFEHEHVQRSWTGLTAAPDARSVLAAPFGPCLWMWTHSEGISVIRGDYSMRASCNSLYGLWLDEESRRWGPAL